MNEPSILNLAEYKATMARIDTLMDINEGEGPELGSTDLEELRTLVGHAEKYEARHFAT